MHKGGSTESITNSSTGNEYNTIPTKIYIPVLVFMIIECLTIVILNLIVVVVLVKNKSVFYQCRSLIISLAIIDLLVGAVSGPMFMPWDRKYPSPSKPVENKWKFYLYVTIPTGISQLSLLHLAAISLERFHATFYPFAYRNIKKRVHYFIIIILWLVAIAGNVILILVHDNKMGNEKLTRGVARQNLLTAPCFFCLLCLFLVGFSYFSIFVKMRYGSRAPQQRQKSEEKRLTKTLFLVTLCSFLTWLPLLIYFMILLSTSMSEPDFFVMSALRYLAGVNSLINPLLYFFRVKEFKKLILNYINWRNDSDQVNLEQTTNL